MYDTVEEAVQKVHNSVVLYNNIPVYITTVTGNNKSGPILHYVPLPLNLNSPTVTSHEASIKDPSWDFRTIATRLGYSRLFIPGLDVWDTVFLSRMPSRHSRQGLDSKTVDIHLVSKGLKHKIGWQEILSENCLLPSAFRGEYVSLDKACSDLLNNEETIKSIPINRRMCIIYDRINPPNILYRGDKIGYTEDGEAIKLAKHKKYLEEELTDVYGFKVA